MAAKELGITLAFEGTGVNERAIVKGIEGQKSPALKVGDIIVKVDPRYFRPAEVETLLGDPTKAAVTLGWKPVTTVKEMCTEMVREDLDQAKRHALLQKFGHEISISLES